MTANAWGTLQCSVSQLFHCSTSSKHGRIHSHSGPFETTPRLTFLSSICNLPPYLEWGKLYRAAVVHNCKHNYVPDGPGTSLRSGHDLLRDSNLN